MARDKVHVMGETVAMIAKSGVEGMMPNYIPHVSIVTNMAITSIIIGRNSTNPREL